VDGLVRMLHFDARSLEAGKVVREIVGRIRIWACVLLK
jgi:hypothetical protein